MSLKITYKPIGYVKVDVSDEEVKSSWDKGLTSIIEVSPEYVEGLRGLEGFSHLIIIYHMHKVGEEEKRTLRVKPRGLLKRGFKLEELPEVGVFATDSPHRPNPIGLTIVELIGVEEGKLIVRGLDAFNGTPILDIKPYTPLRRVEIKCLPKWYLNLISKLEEKEVRKR